jgi:hypothetical protein
MVGQSCLLLSANCSESHAIESNEQQLLEQQQIVLVAKLLVQLNQEVILHFFQERERQSVRERFREKCQIANALVDDVAEEQQT